MAEKDYFSLITAKSDLFSAGASLYKKITQRYVPRDSDNFFVYDECLKDIDNFWTSEKHGLVRNVPLRVKKELVNFFAGIFADVSFDRFDMHEMEECLQTLIKDSRLPEFALSSAEPWSRC